MEELDIMNRNGMMFDSLAERFAEETGLPLQGHHMVQALYIVWERVRNLEWSPDLWDADLSFQECYDALAGFDFNMMFCTVETDAELTRDIRMMERKAQIKSGGVIWHIHRYDADPFLCGIRDLCRN